MWPHVEIIFAATIELKWHQTALGPYDCCPSRKRREETHTHTCTHACTHTRMHTHTHAHTRIHKNTMWRWRKWLEGCRPGISDNHLKLEDGNEAGSLESLEKINPDDILILKSQPPELGGNKCCWFQPPSLWWFVTSVLATGANMYVFQLCTEYFYSNEFEFLFWLEKN